MIGIEEIAIFNASGSVILGKVGEQVVRNIFVGVHVINISGLTEAELENLERQLEAALDEVDRALNPTLEEESCPN